ncbi:MAG: hypothetical protein FWF94_04255 [Oscillospiraceae bacterium]|nr:hypothetical protein [Oscillospiraceae bacterium]
MKKRILAYLIAGAMALSLATTVNASPTGGTTLDPDGDVVYKNTKVFDVTLPTATALDFKLDPQGLLGATGGESLADLAAGAGGIIFDSPAPIINNSSIPVTVTAAIKATGSASHLVVPVANSPANAGNMTSGTGTAASPFVPFDWDNLWDGDDIMNALKANKNTTVSIFASPSADSVTAPTDAYVSSGLGYVLGTTATSIKFVLEAADYTVDAVNPIDNPLTLVAGTGHGTLLQLGGYANPNADWSGFLQDPIIPRKPAQANLTAAYGTAALATAADATVDNHKLWIAVGGDITDMTNPTTTNSVALPSSGPLSNPTALVRVTTNLPATAPSGYAFSTIGGTPTLVRGTAANADTTNNVVYTVDGDYDNLDRVDPNYVLMPRSFVLSALAPAMMNNTNVGRIGLNAVFSYAESTDAEVTAFSTPFGVANITAEGFANDKDTGDAIAYGLLGLGINKAKVVAVGNIAAGGSTSSFAFANPTWSGAFNTIAGAATINQTFTLNNVPAGATITGATFTVSDGTNTTLPTSLTIGTGTGAATVNGAVSVSTAGEVTAITIGLSSSADCNIAAGNINGVTGFGTAAASRLNSALTAKVVVTLSTGATATLNLSFTN